MKSRVATREDGVHSSKKKRGLNFKRMLDDYCEKRAVVGGLPEHEGKYLIFWDFIMF